MGVEWDVHQLLHARQPPPPEGHQDVCLDVAGHQLPEGPTFSSSYVDPGTDAGKAPLEVRSSLLEDGGKGGSSGWAMCVPAPGCKCLGCNHVSKDVDQVNEVVVHLPVCQHRQCHEAETPTVMPAPVFLGLA